MYALEETLGPKLSMVKEHAARLRETAKTVVAQACAMLPAFASAGPYPIEIIKKSCCHIHYLPVPKNQHTAAHAIDQPPFEMSPSLSLSLSDLV